MSFNKRSMTLLKASPLIAFLFFFWQDGAFELCIYAISLRFCDQISLGPSRFLLKNFLIDSRRIFFVEQLGKKIQKFLFFDNNRREIYHWYTDNLLVSLGSYY